MAAPKEAAGALESKLYKKSQKICSFSEAKAPEQSKVSQSALVSKSGRVSRKAIGTMQPSSNVSEAYARESQWRFCVPLPSNVLTPTAENSAVKSTAALLYQASTVVDEALDSDKLASESATVFPDYVTADKRLLQPDGNSSKGRLLPNECFQDVSQHFAQDSTCELMPATECWARPALVPWYKTDGKCATLEKPNDHQVAYAVDVQPLCTLGDYRYSAWNEKPAGSISIQSNWPQVEANRNVNISVSMRPADYSYNNGNQAGEWYWQEQRYHDVDVRLRTEQQFQQGPECAVPQPAGPKAPESSAQGPWPSAGQHTNMCPICRKMYARPSTLKTHMRTHFGDRPFKCLVCAKAFSQAANLTAHYRIHSGDKPFKCHICNRSFSQSSSVTTHLRTHSGERPYNCTLCKKTFSDNSTLTKHLRVHTGERPYTCSICSLRFSQSGNLNRHRKIHMKHN